MNGLRGTQDCRGESLRQKLDVGCGLDEAYDCGLPDGKSGVYVRSYIWSSVSLYGDSPFETSLDVSKTMPESTPSQQDH
jgi:hypothetical protein